MKADFTDEEVIKSIQSADKARVDTAMGFLYKMHFPLVKLFVLKNMGSEEEAMDIFQDTMVIFYVKVRKEEYKQNSSLRTYLYGISKNLWLKNLRNKRTATKHSLGAFEDQDYIDEMNIQDSQITLRSVLELIDEECKELLLDFYFRGREVKELMLDYGLGSEAATKNKKYRCLQKLIRMVKGNGLKKSDFRNE